MGLSMAHTDDTESSEHMEKSIQARKCLL